MAASGMFARAPVAVGVEVLSVVELLVGAADPVVDGEELVAVDDVEVRPLLPSLPPHAASAARPATDRATAAICFGRLTGAPRFGRLSSC